MFSWSIQLADFLGLAAHNRILYKDCVARPQKPHLPLLCRLESGGPLCRKSGH